MPAPLPPDGTAIFIDANIFYYHFVRSGEISNWSSDLLEKVATKRLSAFTSALCLAESIHKIMVAEATQRFAITRSSAVNYLRHHPDQIAQLERFEIAATHLTKFSLSLLIVDTSIFLDSTASSRQYALLTNDAITVALMRFHGLKHLATNDDDFQKIPDLTIWTPRSV